MISSIINVLYALIFVIVSLIMWCAISFKVADNIWGEERLFSSRKNAILVYTVSILIAIIMTGSAYYLIALYQRIK